MQKAAISLAYDGGYASHLSEALPLLRQLGLSATFYIEPPRLLNQLRQWKQVAREGHEIANGTLLGAALPDGSMPAFRIDSILEDVSACEELLEET
ncbi:MAG: polysaccharide deacetylase family protein, partial [Armatimonadota bacterium]